MTEKDIYTIWLSQIKGIGTVSQHKLLRAGLNSEQIYKAIMNNTCNLLTEKRVEQKLINLLKDNKDLQKAKKIYQNCKENHIRILSVENGELPERFSKFDSLPILLYAKGQDIPLVLGTGIVGARRCSRSAKGMAIMIGQDMVIHGNYVISGMAKGVDSYAHTAVLKEDAGIPVAVLGHGLDLCYPKEHASLYEAILQRGLAVSEYPPGTPPRHFRFPRRNRIIAALCDWIYVITPGSNSGTRSTIEAACEYGVKYELVPL